jgi:hypothetical protein
LPQATPGEPLYGVKLLKFPHYKTKLIPSIKPPL